jgi:acyl carrier protein
MDEASRARLVDLIAIELQLPPDKVRRGASLRKDLGMDSVAALNILFAAEEAFGIRVPEGELEQVDDVDAIVALIDRYESTTAAPPVTSR